MPPPQPDHQTGDEDGQRNDDHEQPAEYQDLRSGQLHRELERRLRADGERFILILKPSDGIQEVITVSRDESERVDAAHETGVAHHHDS